MPRSFLIKPTLSSTLETDGGFEHKDKSGPGGMWFIIFEHFEKVRDLHGKQWVPSRFEIKSSRSRFLCSLL